MPSAQIIDLGPDIYKQERNVGGFISDLSDAVKSRKEDDTINNLISQYQKNREDANAWKDLQLNLEKSPISPTKRLQTQSSLNEMQKTISLRDKALNQKSKDLMDQKQNQETRRSLQEAGASSQQLALFDSAPVGGKTKVIEDVLDTLNREKTPPGLSSPDLIDYDKGLTPKERVKRQETRFTSQTPLVTKNSEQLNALQNEYLSLELLNELNDSKKVGQGVHNLNINPKTGDLIFPKAATAEEQLFVKTVNDFTVKAKDSFGARVTNFELDRFMQRLPTLANSEEGRRLIMRQMKIINELNQIEKKALQEVFDQYGVRNIDYVDAENKARERIKDQKEALRKEYLDYEQLSKKEEIELIKNVQARIRDGYTALRKPDGTIKQFPSGNVPNLLEKGYKQL